MLFSSPSSKGHITTPATKISDCIADANFVEASYDCLPPEYDMRDLDTLALCSDSDSENDDSSSGHGLSASREDNILDRSRRPDTSPLYASHKAIF